MTLVAIIALLDLGAVEGVSTAPGLDPGKAGPPPPGPGPVPAGGETQCHYNSVCDATPRGAAMKWSVIMASRPSNEAAACAAVCDALLWDALQSFH